MASITNTASGAGGNALAHSLRGALQLPLGRDAEGRLTNEYADLIVHIDRQPRPTLWQRFTIALAGQR